MTPRRLAVLVVVSFLAGAAAVALANDDKISQDYLKDVRGHGRAKAKERAEFWEKKGVTGKDLYWLARLWDEGGEDAKAVETYDAFLKVPDGNPKNRASAAFYKIQAYKSLKQWPKVVESADQYRAEFPEGDPGIIAETFDLQGQAWRMQGDRDKAVASFQSASDKKFTDGTFNLVDILLVEGKLDDAKALMKKAIEEAAAGKEKSLKPMAEALEWIGQPAPKLEGAASVGGADAPTDLTGKPTFIYFWNVQSPTLDAAFANATHYQKAWGDSARVLLVSGYDKFNLTTHKKEPDLPPEQEAGYTKQLLQQSNIALPAIIVPDALKESLHLGLQNGEKIVIDKAGKFRWIRLAADTLYDWYCVDTIVKKVASE
jgi:tetratricopeptide (TPR) repeat protein